MHKIVTATLSGAIALTATGLALAQEVPKGLPPGYKLPVPQMIDGAPAFEQQTLSLADIPKPNGRTISLFNGRDLSAFTPWLGKADAMIFPGSGEKPLGRTGIGETFKVVQIDGAPAIYASGRIWGSINTKRSFSNYHLSMSFKFGQQWMPDVPPNSGVLYHSYGEEGAFFGTWMKSVEFEMGSGKTGMMVPVGRDLRMNIAVGKDTGKDIFGGPQYGFMTGGKLAEIRAPTQVCSARNFERPMGEWNRLDLYVAGDKAVHVVNGVPVMEISGLRLLGPNGKTVPLTKGLIQLQSEGTEVYFRDVEIVPIKNVPRVVVAIPASR